MLGLTAEQLGTVLFAAALAITTFLGGKKGREIITKAPPQQPQQFMEVAGAVVSDKSVDRMVASLDAFSSSASIMTQAINRDVEAKAKLTAALNRNSEVSEDMRDEIKDTGAKMEALTREMIRAQHK